MSIEMEITRSLPVVYFQDNENKWTGKIIKPQSGIKNDVNGLNSVELNLS